MNIHEFIYEKTLGLYTSKNFVVDKPVFTSDCFKSSIVIISNRNGYMGLVECYSNLVVDCMVVDEDGEQLYWETHCELTEELAEKALLRLLEKMS